MVDASTRNRRTNRAADGDATIPIADDAACCAVAGRCAAQRRRCARARPRIAALSDPVRLRCLSLIASADECCSCDLEAPLGRSQPTISHHTKVLAEAGLIVGEKRGRWMWWKPSPNAWPPSARLGSTGAG